MLRRFIVRSLFALFAIALLAAIIGVGLVRRQLPDLVAPAMRELSAPVEATFDDRAVPTVRAASLMDALRVQGFLVARERMFQLELSRRAAKGTLSEIFGAAALPVDKLHRLYGFAQVAEAAVALLPADQRAQLEAYAAGVNAFIDSHDGKWGVELELLRVTPRPWTAADSLEVLLLMYEDLTTSWKDELFADSIAKLPPAYARFLMPRVTGDDVLLVPDADPKPSPDAPSLFTETHAARTPQPIPADPLGLPSWAGARARDIGSNNWAIAPGRSRSGKALLANDPHLSLMAPGFWYAVRFELPSRVVQGVALAGLPGVVIGQNDRVAWGFTNLGTDVQDLYREAKQSERVETIAVKNGASVELRVAIGKHGPQVRPGYSLQWVALDPKNLRVPLGAMMDATDWATFNAAIDEYFGPAQNVVYADVDGHIGWRASGLVPIRKAGDDGARVHDGADAANDWRGFVAMQELPRVLDPPQGYVVTANQRVVGTSFRIPIATDWVAPNRARRIVQRIEAAAKIDREEIESIQLDVVSPFHRELVELLRKQLPSDETLASLSSWDGAARSEDRRFLVARMWERALHQVLGAQLQLDPEFDWQNDETTLLALLRADDAAWTRAGLGDRAAFLKSASAAAAASIAAERDKTWGEHNMLHIEHPIGRAGGVLAWLFNPPSFPQSGASATVRAATPDFGQSMRFIVDWGAPHESTIVLPLGQSGHLASPHRHDQQPFWHTGDPNGAHTRFEQPSSASIRFAP